MFFFNCNPGPLRGGGQGGKLPRAPRQRRGSVIPQNEFFIATWDESRS